MNPKKPKLKSFLDHYKSVRKIKPPPPKVFKSDKDYKRKTKHKEPPQ